MRLTGSILCKSLLHLALIASVPVPISADIILFRNMGNTIVPIHESNISMEAETVFVRQAMGGDIAQCKFVMKSHSDSSITSIVGFPINRPPWYPDFKVKVNGLDTRVSRTLRGANGGHPIEHVLYYTSDIEGLDYPGFYTWNSNWKPRETVIIEIEYTAGLPDRIRGIVTGWQYSYIVRTGNYWKGSIGHALISVEYSKNRFPDRMMVEVGDPSDPLSSRVVCTDAYIERGTYPSNMKRDISDDGSIVLTWEFFNWNPTEDIIFERYAWAGVNGLYSSFRLPQNYLGATEYYGKEYIDRLTEAEFFHAAQYFPQRADSTNRDPYRYAIADLLRSEILARNGYTFESHNTGRNRLSAYFVSYRKAWYNYRSTLPLAEVEKKLTDTERMNYEYLGHYLVGVGRRIVCE